MDLKKLSYVDADYRPSAWLAYMLTSKPAGNDALVTMLPRLNTDNVVLTQNKAERRAAKDTARENQAKINKDPLPKLPPREVIMFHKIARHAECDSTAHLKRKLDAFTTHLAYLQDAGLDDEVRKYKRMQLDAITEMCDALVKLDAVNMKSHANTVIDLLNSSTSSSRIDLSIDEDDTYST